MSHQSVEVTFLSYNTIRVTMTLTELDGTTLLIDCNDHVIKLMKPDGVQKGDDYTEPTNNADGSYTQDIIIDEDDLSGIWSIDWRIIYNLKPSRDITNFKVE